MTKADCLLLLVDDEELHSRRRRCRFAAVRHVLRQRIQLGI